MCVCVYVYLSVYMCVCVRYNKQTVADCLNVIAFSFHSLGLCSECVDQQSAATCASWAEYCGNASYRTFMETNCKRYCG